MKVKCAVVERGRGSRISPVPSLSQQPAAQPRPGVPVPYLEGTRRVMMRVMMTHQQAGAAAAGPVLSGA